MYASVNSEIHRSAIISALPGIRKYESGIFL